VDPSRKTVNGGSIPEPRKVTYCEAWFGIAWFCVLSIAPSIPITPLLAPAGHGGIPPPGHSSNNKHKTSKQTFGSFWGPGPGKLEIDRVLRATRRTTAQDPHTQPHTRTPQPHTTPAHHHTTPAHPRTTPTNHTRTPHPHARCPAQLDRVFPTTRRTTAQPGLHTLPTRRHTSTPHPHTHTITRPCNSSQQGKEKARKRGLRQRNAIVEMGNSRGMMGNSGFGSAQNIII